MAYYGESQWPAGSASQPSTSWDHQTPPNRSGASSTIPTQEASTAFWYQFEEVDRALENLVKSGKMFGMPGGRHPRGPGGPQRPHSVEFDGRPGHPTTNLQNFYASQRHQSSRGSNEAEQMIQQKRRMAAQRERELRLHHQEQQYNRTAFGDMHFAPGNVNAASTKPDRTLSPGAVSEEARRELIARQRSALYGEPPFGETGGYVDETGTTRPGVPGHHGTASNLRGPSPLAYEYGRGAASRPEAGLPTSVDPAPAGGQQQQSRASSNASPQSNPPVTKGPLESVSRTSNSSPGSGSPQNGRSATGKVVAPIGTRPSAPSATHGPVNPALSRQSTTSLPSPLNHGYTAPASGDVLSSTAAGAAEPASASGEPTAGLGNWGQRGGPWGSKPQASVWARG